MLTSVSKKRRFRVHILKDQQALDDLDLWPGDFVYGKEPEYGYLGHVNDEGVFVTNVPDYMGLKEL